MGIQRNFAVRNGLEVSTDLLVADNSLQKVGIENFLEAAELGEAFINQ